MGEQSCLLLLLPCDLLLNILSRIDYTQIVKLRCVCKFLLDLTSNDPRFIDSFQQLYINEILRPDLCSKYHRKFHVFSNSSKGTSSFIFSHSLNQLAPFHCPLVRFIFSHSLNQLAPFHCPPNKRLIGSCDGFLCFGGEGAETTIEIYSIAAPVRFSVSPCSEGDNNVTETYSYARYGFGYNQKTKDYNVVCFINRGTWKIFSIRSRKWRYVEGSGAPVDEDSWSTLLGTSSCTRCGVIGWLPGTSCTGKIITFDLNTERFTVIRFGAIISPNNLNFHAVYRGQLALAYLSGGSCKVVLYAPPVRKRGHEWLLQIYHPVFTSTKVNRIEIVSFDDQIYILEFEGEHAKLFNMETKRSEVLQLSSDEYLKWKPVVKSINM